MGYKGQVKNPNGSTSDVFVIDDVDCLSSKAEEYICMEQDDEIKVPAYPGIIPHKETFRKSDISVTYVSAAHGNHSIKITYPGETMKVIEFDHCDQRNGENKIFSDATGEDLRQIQAAEEALKEMPIINLTGIDLPEVSGFIKPGEKELKSIQEDLKFEKVPDEFNLRVRANSLAACASITRNSYRHETGGEIKKVMIYGDALLMSLLEEKLRKAGYIPLYAYFINGAYKGHVEL